MALVSGKKQEGTLARNRRYRRYREWRNANSSENIPAKAFLLNPWRRADRHRQPRRGEAVAKRQYIPLQKRHNQMQEKENVEARIIVTHGRRADLKVTIDVYDPQADKLNPLGIRVGPSRGEIDDAIRKLKVQLERAGNHVTVIERT